MEHRVDSRNLHSETRYEEFAKTIYLPERASIIFSQWTRRISFLKKYRETLIISVYTNSVVEVHPIAT